MRTFFPELDARRRCSTASARRRRQTKIPTTSSRAARSREHVSLHRACARRARSFPSKRRRAASTCAASETYTLIVRDISERKRAEMELQAQAESLAQGDDASSRRSTTSWRSGRWSSSGRWRRAAASTRR